MMLDALADDFTKSLIVGLMGSLAGVMGSFGLVLYQSKMAQRARIDEVAEKVLSITARML
ncbi:MAG: hypothetical protein ACK5XS_04940 [Armatimonadota bacterium]|nr:hypothetical protein [Fimbriimonadaceae bacterium]MCZ8137732.1 hypothetical protein [Fimbriimonadaceae bacterium]